jgi:hypothetical protein
MFFRVIFSSSKKLKNTKGGNLALQKKCSSEKHEKIEKRKKMRELITLVRGK